MKKTRKRKLKMIKKKKKKNDQFTKGLRSVKELEYDCFYLSLKQYEYDYIPNAISERPMDPQENWSFGKFYDRPDGWQFEQEKYKRELKAWKVKSLIPIKKLDYKELKNWKIEYQEKKGAICAAFEKKEIALPVIDGEKDKERHFYIVDSGASCNHFVYHWY